MCTPSRCKGLPMLGGREVQHTATLSIGTASIRDKISKHQTNISSNRKINALKMMTEDFSRPFLRLILLFLLLPWLPLQYHHWEEAPGKLESLLFPNEIGYGKKNTNQSQGVDVTLLEICSSKHIKKQSYREEVKWDRIRQVVNNSIGLY